VLRRCYGRGNLSPPQEANRPPHSERPAKAGAPARTRARWVIYRSHPWQSPVSISAPRLPQRSQATRRSASGPLVGRRTPHRWHSAFARSTAGSPHHRQAGASRGNVASLVLDMGVGIVRSSRGRNGRTPGMMIVAPQRPHRGAMNRTIRQPASCSGRREAVNHAFRPRHVACVACGYPRSREFSRDTLQCVGKDAMAAANRSGHRRFGGLRSSRRWTAVRSIPT
jgi:ribosomal protein L37E